MKTDSTLLEALKKKEEKAIRYLYWEYFEPVKKHVVLNNGSEQDAEDLFQEALLVLLKNISKENFILTSSLKTYLFAITRNLWLNELSERKNRSTAPVTSFLEDTLPEDTTVTREEEWDSLKVVFEQITTFCSQLLNDIFIAGIVPDKYKNAHTFQNQKYKCLLQARKAAVKIKTIYG